MSTPEPAKALQSPEEEKICLLIMTFIKEKTQILILTLQIVILFL